MSWRPSWLTFPPMAFALVVVLPITLMLIDRTPPYERVSGTINAHPPEQCNLEPTAPRDIVPGACVSVVWTVRAIRPCKAAPGFNVIRHLVTSNGNRVYLGQTRSEYPQLGGPKDGPLQRVFVLPLTTPEGITEYQAEARFVCNPLQEFLSTYVTSILDVVVDRPNVRFIVGRVSTEGKN